MIKYHYGAVTWYNLMTKIIRKSVQSRGTNYCPISACAEVLSDHWSVIILRDIALCDQRTFRSIKANNNENISSSILAVRLKRLCDIEMLHFKDDPEHLQRKIYCLTSKSLDLIPILIDMAVWGLTHASPYDEQSAIPSPMYRPQSPYSKDLVHRLRSLHLDPDD